MKFYLTLTLMVVLLLIAFVFGSQNEQVIALNYLIAKANISVAMAVSIFTVLGFFLGILFMILLKLFKPRKQKAVKG